MIFKTFSSTDHQWSLMAITFPIIMAIWVVEFSKGDTKLEIFLPKNQHTQRKLLNFENW
jgi:hypothetical protein